MARKFCFSGRHASRDFGRMVSGMERRLHAYAKKIFLRSLQGLQGGSLEIVCPGATYAFGNLAGELHATAVIHNERFFWRALTGADVGIGESYMDGDWTSPDLVALVRLVTRNLRRVDGGHRFLTGLRSLLLRVRHKLHGNSLGGSRHNIQAHYDVGNDFYRLFLDRDMLYSSAYFQLPADTLDDAQQNKMELVCRKLQMEPGDRVLEIGCGWGSLAMHAAARHGAHVTGITISPAQFEFATKRLSEADVAPGSVRFLLQDYRNLHGEFDKIVSIEMFEAVGLKRYDEFFRACDRLLTPNGSLLMQTITLPEQELRAYRRRVDWIQTYIFPGSELAFLGEIQKSIGRVAELSLTHLESFGMHYAKTLELWRERFFQRLGSVQELGFPDSFQRMWDFYLSWCEGAFLERYINVVHLLMTKNGAGKTPMFPTRLPAEEFSAG
jgi:cyclopropane-fatty-acyl-phospholipid synthase